LYIRLSPFDFHVVLAESLPGCYKTSGIFVSVLIKLNFVAPPIVLDANFS